MKKLLCLGHSHIGSLIFATREYPRSDVAIDFINLLDGRYLNRHVVAFEAIREDATAKAHDVDAIILSLSGNEHHTLGMVMPDRPFDFCLPEWGKDDGFHGHELLPYGLVRGTLESLISKPYYNFFAGLFDKPVYAIAPPPPILEPSHLAQFPSVFKDSIVARGVSPEWIRLKLWQLYCTIAREWSTEAGFKFVEVPPVNIGPEGYIHSAGLLEDPTHANAWYGRNLIEHLLGILETTDA